MASNSKLRLSTEGLENLIRHFSKLGADVESAAEHALNNAADQVMEDTREALKKPALPAQGKYSQSSSQYASAEEVLTKSGVMTVGTHKEIEVGFSKMTSAPFLIYGTPDMAPDAELKKIYTSKSYRDKLSAEMAADFEAEIRRKTK